MEELLNYNKEIIVIVLGFLIITIASNQIAKIFQKIRLPLVTGLIFTGVLAGPYLLGLIPVSAKANLQFINEISLAFIAFAAGSELYLRELRSRLKVIQISAVVQSFFGFALGAVLVFFLTDYIYFTKELSLTGRWVVSLLTSVLFVAPSPASVIAVISELRAQGPFTKTILGVTMAKDFLVVIMFAVVLSISKSLMNGAGVNLLDFVVLLAELAFSFALAYVVGKLLHAILKWGRNQYLKTTLVLLLGWLNYVFSHFFRDFSSSLFSHEVYLEPLLICLIASFYIANYTKYRAEFLKLIQDVSLYIYVAFFTLTGASMNLSVLESVWAVSLVLFLLRLVIVITGTSAGSLLTKESAKMHSVGWMPYIAQAGVALGLVTVVAQEFPTWGPDFAIVSIAVIIINQLIGPPLITKAISVMGENRSRASTPDFDGVKDALIFGHESQSMALALQLKSKGWNVELVTKKQRDEVENLEGVKFHFIESVSKDFFKTLDAQKYDAIVGMLSDYENLKICQIVYEEIGTQDIVVQLNDRHNKDKFLPYGARVVDPATAMVSLMDHFVRSPQATSLLLGLETGKDSRDIILRNPDIHGLSLRELRLPSDVIILSVMRGGSIIITHGYTRLRMGDILTFVGSDKSLDVVQFKFGR